MSNKTLITHERTVVFTYILLLFTALISPFVLNLNTTRDILGTAFISIFFITIPGYLILNKLFIKISLEEKVIFGSILMISIVIPTHAFFSKVNLSAITYLLIISLYLLLFNKKMFFYQKIEIEKLNILLFFSVVFVLYLFVFRQSLHIPISNFDQFLVWPDSYNALAQTAEITNHGPEIYPFLASAQVPLNYHWGSFSLASFLSGSGAFALPISLFKTEFIFVSFLIFASLYLTGRNLAQSKMSGIVATLLGGLTLYPVFPEINELIGLSRPQISTTSMPQLVSNLLLIGGIYFTYNYKSLNINKWFYPILIFLTTFSTTLSKGPNGVLLIIILTLLSLFTFTKLKIINQIIPALFGFIGAFSIISSSQTVSGQSGMSLWINPKNTLNLLLSSYNLDLVKINYLFFIGLTLFSFISIFLAFIYMIKNKNLFKFIPLFAASVAGIGGTFILEAWGYSQFFLLYGAIPIMGIFLSSVTFYEKQSLNIKRVSPFLIGLFIQPIIFQVISSIINKDSIIKIYSSWIISVILVIIFTVIYSKISNLNILYSLLILSLGIGSLTGLTKYDSKAYAEPMHPYSLTPGTSGIAEYLKDNSSSLDLVATNRHCAGKEELQDCTARQFGLSALSERRVFIEGWSYTTCPLEQAITNRYWKESDWRLNQEFFINPAENWDKFRKTGVKWLVVDQTREFSTNLNQIAELKFQEKDMSLWKITDPYNGPKLKVENPCGKSSNY